jgi:hypothetical protein
MPIGIIISDMRKLRHLRLLVTGTGIILGIFSLGPANAASANISHSYNGSGNIPNGSIVSLDPSHSGYVELANTSNNSRLIGVALNSKDSLLAVNPTSGTVQVAINGTVNTLVSTVNGNIKVGDQISASPFSGIGMLTTPGMHFIGIAQTNFTNTSPQATVEQVKDKTGVVHKIDVGYIRLSIAIGSNSTSGAGSNADALQRLIKSLTGQTISVIRIILSIMVACITLVSLVTIIYASIYGSIISIGRNPLAQHAVFRTLTSVMIMALLTITIASVTIYYLLK